MSLDTTRSIHCPPTTAIGLPCGINPQKIRPEFGGIAIVVEWSQRLVIPAPEPKLSPQLEKNGLNEVNFSELKKLARQAIFQKSVQGSSGAGAGAHGYGCVRRAALTMTSPPCAAGAVNVKRIFCTRPISPVPFS